MAKALDKPSLHDSDYVPWLKEQAAHRLSETMYPHRPTPSNRFSNVSRQPHS